MQEFGKEILQIYDHYDVAAGVCIDSRKVRKGGIFFGIPGTTVNGGMFAETALAAGAALAVVDRVELRGEKGVVVVPDVVKALQATARLHRASLRYPIVGITGSNGKTTTRLLLQAALGTRYHVQATEGNYNNELGVPLTLLSMQPNHEIGVVEMGANHPGEIMSLCEIAHPTHGLITSIGEAHLEGFGTLEGVAQAKGELFAYLKRCEGTGFVRDDDPSVRNIAEQLHLGCSASHYSMEGYQAQCWVEADGKLSFTLIWRGTEYTVRTQLMGEYNAINALAAVHVAHHFNVPLDEACAAVGAYYPSNHRSQLIDMGRMRLVADCYNANLASMRAAIESFGRIVTHERKIAILGAMREMGMASHEAHRAIGFLMQTHAAVEALYVGDEWDALPGADRGRIFPNWQACARYLHGVDLAGSLVLIKGSHSVGLEHLIGEIGIQMGLRESGE